MSTTNTRHGLTVGQTVIYTNDYGLKFGPYRVVRFASPDETLLSGADVFINKTSYWCPVKATSLKPV